MMKKQKLNKLTIIVSITFNEFSTSLARTHTHARALLERIYYAKYANEGSSIAATMIFTCVHDALRQCSIQWKLFKSFHSLDFVYSLCALCMLFVCAVHDLCSHFLSYRERISCDFIEIEFTFFNSENHSHTLEIVCISWFDWSANSVFLCVLLHIFDDRWVQHCLIRKRNRDYTCLS